MIKAHGLSTGVIAGLFAAATLPCSALADNTPQALPFFQDWSNIDLITANDNWSGVPGIVGYRGDGLAVGTGVDPQIILVDGTNTPVDVNANQTNPNSFTTGGVTEFHLANPVVALTGSGTAKAPFLLLSLDTIGASEITVSYLLRDLESGTDNSIQPVALHYRIGDSGDFINLPAAFVADASAGPSLIKVTAVTIELPDIADNQPLIQLRWMTADALGNDEWIGIDNITVTIGSIDTDGDGWQDGIDNCPDIFNPGQEDADNNGVGDVCEAGCNQRIDKDCDGVPDRFDNCPQISNPGQEDCNNNSLGDVCDIAFGISLDCNLNGIPDECENDCNGNGIPDACDIANGTSQDTNNNGQPDECESNVAIVLNELHTDPHLSEGDANNDGIVNTSDDEFVEFINVQGTPVNISGWTISDAVGVRHTFPAGTVLQNNCGIIVFGGGNPNGQFGGMVVQKASSGALGLNNAGDTVTLLDNLGLHVTSYSYGPEGGNDRSITRTPDIVGDFQLHQPARFSAGRKIDGSLFSGCSALPDSDNDGIPDATDNCPFNANASQSDCDGDGLGDVCESDPDANGNGIPDNCEITTPPTNIFLNEIRIDEPGADNNEYVEIKGPAAASLSGLTIVVIGDGDVAQGSGVIEHVTSLNGQVIPADGHFLLTEATFVMASPAQQNMVVFGGAPGGLNFENSDNVTFLLVTNFTGALTQDLDADNDGVIDANPPWSHVVDAVGLVRTPLTTPPGTGIEWYYGAQQGGADVGPDGTFVPGHVYRCETSGAWTIGRFDPVDPEGGTDTPGVGNLTCPAPACPADITGDTTVNVNDLLAVINGWGACPVPPTPCPADITGDNIVNVNDLLAVINGWGQCPQ